MNRRTLLKGTLLGTLAAGLPYSRIFADGTPGQGTAVKGFHQFKLGDLDLVIVSDGSLSLGPVQPFYAPGVAPGLVKKALEDSFRPTDAIALGINILVVKKGQTTILIDTGTGPGFGSGAGWLPQSLVAAGIKPSDVTDIVLTHGHADHIGGLLDAKEAFAFPAAKVYISKKEHEFWMADHQDFSRCTLNDKTALNGMAATAKKILTVISDRLHLYRPEDQLFDCIRFEEATGHTPGHMLVKVYSGNDELVHVADLVHSDVLLFPHPEWGFGGDTDFHAGVATRKRVLEELAVSRKKVLAYHLAWPGLGHVRKKSSGYEWVPDTFAFPG